MKKKALKIGRLFFSEKVVCAIKNNPPIVFIVLRFFYNNKYPFNKSIISKYKIWY